MSSEENKKEVFIDSSTLDKLDSLHGNGSCYIVYTCISCGAQVKRNFYPSKKEAYKTLKCERCSKAKVDHGPGYSKDNPLLLSAPYDPTIFDQFISTNRNRVWISYNCTTCNKPVITEFSSWDYKKDEKLRLSMRKFQCRECNCKDSKQYIYDEIESRNKEYEDSFDHYIDPITGVSYKIIHDINEIQRLRTNEEKIVYHCSDPDCVYHENEWFKMECAKKDRIPDYIKFGKLLCETHRFNLNYPKEQAAVVRAETNTKIYGVPSPMQNPEFKAEYFNRIHETYGDEINSTLQLSEVQAKIKETNLKVYGTEYPIQSDIVKERIAEKWEGKTPEEILEIRNKRIDTNRERYDADWYLESDECIELRNAGLLREFGTTDPMGDPIVGPIFREKAKQANLKKFNAVAYFASDQFQEDMSKPGARSICRFYYYGMAFDSSWELAVWIYCHDHMIPIIRSPIVLQYYHKDKLHYCNPDFMINGKLVEIKGGQFIDPEGNMYLPYRNPEWSDEEYKDKCDLYKAKQQCLIQNNVEIWLEKDLDYVFEYIDQVYGKHYLLQFRNDSNYNPSYTFDYTVFYTYPILPNVGITPYDCDMNEEYTEPIGKGITPFDIGLARIKKND